MPNTISRLPSIEVAVRTWLLATYPPLLELDPTAASAAVGGDLAYDPADQEFYIRLDRLPGSVGRHEGDLPVEVEVFAGSYLVAESHALDIEALLLGYPHVVEVDGRPVVFDTVYQNVGVAELPWEDDDTFRLGATYVITTRRR